MMYFNIESCNVQTPEEQRTWMYDAYSRKEKYVIIRVLKCGHERERVILNTLGASRTDIFANGT